MKTIKVYNIKRFMERELKDHNLTAFGWDETLAIVSNEKGKSLVIDRDGVFTIHENLQSKVTIGLTTKQEEGSRTIPMMASHYTQLAIEDIARECEFEEIALGKFIRIFGDRLEHNYSNIIKHISSELELDGASYDNGRLGRKANKVVKNI